MEIGQIAAESARGSFYLMVGAAVSTVIEAVGVIVIARLLGPSNYGLYTLAFVLPGLFASIADLGVSPAMTRYAASLRSEQRYRRLASMMSSGLFFSIIAGVVVLLLVVRFSGQLAGTVLQRQNLGMLVAFASLTIPFQMVFSLAYDTFVGLDKTEDSARMTILFGAVKSVLAPVLIIAGFGLAGAVFGLASAWILAGVVGVSLMLSHRRVLNKFANEREDASGLQEDARTIIRFGMPLYFGGLLGALLVQYQNVVLAFFASNAEIGSFNAAANFGALIGIVAGPIGTALFPAFSKLDLQTRKDELSRMFELSIRYTTLLILPVAVGVGVLSKELIQVVYGLAYGNAATYLMLYVVTFLLTILGTYVIDDFLSGIGKTTETLKITAVQMAILLPAAPALAWLWSVPGLIAAIILSEIVAAVFGLRLAIGKYGMRIHLKGSLAALGAALMSALPILPIVHYSPLPSVAKVLIGAPLYLATYLTLAPLLKAVKRNDLQILAKALGQIKIIGPVTDRILAYERWILEGSKGAEKQSH